LIFDQLENWMKVLKLKCTFVSPQNLLNGLTIPVIKDNPGYPHPPVFFDIFSVFESGDITSHLKRAFSRNIAFVGDHPIHDFPTLYFVSK